MSGLLLAESRKALQGLDRFIDQAEALRGAGASVTGKAVTATKCPYLALDSKVDEQIDLRLLEHCLVYTRAYAILEYFVFQRLSTLLFFLENNYAFHQIPGEARLALRRGTAAILTNLTKDRYKKWDEADLVKNYSNAVSGDEFRLIPEAVLRNEQNYRLDEISRLYALCGVSGVADWVSRHSAIRDFLQSATWETGTAESLLRLIIDYRNEAAHGSVSEISSPPLLREAISFIGLLIDVLYERIQICLLERMMKLGQLRRVASVTESYKSNAVVADWTGASVYIGDQLVTERDGLLRLVTVLNLRLDDVDVKYVRGTGQFELGLLLNDRVKTEKPLYVFEENVDTSVL